MDLLQQKIQELSDEVLYNVDLGLLTALVNDTLSHLPSEKGVGEL